MPHLLKRHPDSRSTEVHSITVNAIRAGKPGAVLVSYVVEGAMNGLRIPAALSPARADRLWEHTCFELFIRPPEGEAYFEFNFSPSMQWAAYRFARWRSGLTNIEMPAPAVDFHVAERAELVAVLDLSSVPGLPTNQPWRANITTVIEQTNGEKSVWALQHAPGKADFHHADGFVLDLPVPQQK